MPFPNIPSDTRDFVKFIRGADAFYKGHRIYSMWTGQGQAGYRWAEKMATTLAKVEARRATRH